MNILLCSGTVCWFVYSEKQHRLGGFEPSNKVTLVISANPRLQMVLMISRYYFMILIDNQIFDDTLTCSDGGAADLRSDSFWFEVLNWRQNNLQSLILWRVGIRWRYPKLSYPRLWFLLSYFEYYFYVQGHCKLLHAVLLCSRCSDMEYCGHGLKE